MITLVGPPADAVEVVAHTQHRARSTAEATATRRRIVLIIEAPRPGTVCSSSRLVLSSKLLDRERCARHLIYTARPQSVRTRDRIQDCNVSATARAVAS